MSWCSDAPEDEAISLFAGLLANPDMSLYPLDGIPGLVPGLVPGIQGCKNPGSLGKTWDQAKSLKFILIDSNFWSHPVRSPLVTLRISPSFSKIFFER